MARLVKLAGDVAWESFELGDTVLIGRSADTQVTIPDKSISRHHARITQSDEGFFVEDLGSTNGTFVNGRRISRKLLKDGDEIRLRKTIFRFRAEMPKAKSTDISVIMDTPESSSHQILKKLDARVPTDSHIIPPAPRAKPGDTERMLLRLRTFHEVADAIGLVQELDPLLQRIMDSLFKVFIQAERGFIMLQEEEGSDHFVPRVVRRQAPSDSQEITISSSIINEVVNRKVGILSSDAQRDERFEGRQSVAGLHIRSMMCVPLICQGEILGIIHIDTTSAAGSFDYDDLHLLTGIAGQAAISIRNAQLIKELQQEATRRSLLARYLSPALVGQVMKGSLDLELGGELRKGTIFFCDIIGFTQMALTMRPDEVVRHLNQYFEIMLDLIFAHHGMVDKLGGDAIMAVWGIPLEREGDALSAAHAALQMQNTLFVFNISLHREGINPIQMGIGLNSGAFLAGNIGSAKRMEYTVVGDNVNLAQRIQSRATRGQVYISESTYEQAMGKLLAVRMPPTSLKGLGGTVGLFCVRGAIQHEGDEGEEFVLSIPVSFTTTPERSERQGQLVGASIDAADELELVMLAAEELTPDTELTVTLRLPEKPGMPEIKAVVTRSRTVTGEGGETSHAELILRPVVLPLPFSRFLRSRQILPADRSVDEILRE